MPRVTTKQRKAAMPAPVLVDGPPTPANLPMVIEQSPEVLVSFADLAIKINAEFDAAASADDIANNHRVIAGRMLKEAKQRLSVKSSDQTFAQWCEKHITRSKADIYRCLALVADDKPEAIAAAVTRERTRGATQKRQDRQRQSQTSETTKPLAAAILAVPHIVDAAWVEVIPKDHAFGMLQTLAAELTRYVLDAGSMRLAKSAAIEQSIAACRVWLKAVAPPFGADVGQIPAGDQ